MKLDGTADFPYAAADVWAALHDTDILVKAVPGCKSMVADGEGIYRAAVSLGVAAIKGDYEGKVRVTDVEFPHHYVMDGEGSGKPGYVKVNVDCRLVPTASGTTMNWSCDAEVGGLIAGIGGRVLSGISKHLAKQFFKALNTEMKTTYGETQIESTKG
jgi:carbon monoxide dehydrogenase subunit G